MAPPASGTRDPLVVRAPEPLDRALLASAMSVVDANGDLIDGEIDVLLDGKLIETVRAGGVVGEMALIDAGPRSATAISRTRCLLSPVDERRFIDLICRGPELALSVMRVLARRLRRMDIAR